ncbi:MAG: tRNA-specific 2-thiouridylase MnmA [Parcubacteria group bacterium Gr01-1014_19]|nr:MAG: tRNA-specific 2-thiouridylase MnmA [Parcubacteria group bacterium Gr01-1014_19]
MSGGVDSSVAAALLKKQGYDVVGIHLKCFNVDGCAAQDAEDARRAAEHLNIPFYTFDYEKEYKKRVVDYMVAGYKKGITPNPDVMCNKEIKFGLFFDKAMELGADFVATGHYVRRLTTNDKRQVNSSDHKSSVVSRQLAVAKDGNKDQSYFLWAIKPEHLKKCLFPIGEYKKPQVRKLAEKFGLHNAAKKDSQGICFLGQVDLPDFLKKYIKPKKGVIVDVHGNELGEHHGAHFYTIGQRHGINITNNKRLATNDGDTKPHYVVSKDVKNNVLVVAEEDAPELYRKEVELSDVNLFLPVVSRTSSVSVYARVRYRQPVSPARLVVRRSSSVIRGKSSVVSCKLTFAKPVRFVASGQSAVFYDSKGVMLGGGIIK